MTPVMVLLLLAVFGQTSGLSSVNIARSGKVTQSSTYGHGKPEKAIDGSHASNWVQKSCTLTNQDLSPWWRLDLQKSHWVYSVTITNRGDCCHKRLNGAEIHIGDSIHDNGNANPICATIRSIGPGRSRTFQCKGMVGRYVNIVIPGRKECLTLCEVEVNGQPSGNIGVNIARSGKVTQSSTYGHGKPERAIDGNHASNWGQGSCTVTKKQKSPWWRLDLLNPYKVYTVTITNRKDCCHQRLNGAEIHIGDSLYDNGNANPICASIQVMEPGETRTFQCEGMVGRYVNIVIPGKHEYLTLCEVEVSGQPSENMGINIALLGKAAQSTLYGNARPEKAIDGNRASNYQQGSCSVTNGDLSPWWRLDLLKQYKVYTVTITNRRDCCSQRLNGAQIHIGDSLYDNGNTNPICTVIASIPAGARKTFQCHGMRGRYVNIVIPNRREYLTLCEVEVTGIQSNDDDDVDYHKCY